MLVSRVLIAEAEVEASDLEEAALELCAKAMGPAANANPINKKAKIFFIELLFN